LERRPQLAAALAEAAKSVARWQWQSSTV
jgi:hypothetical protein